MMLISGFKSLGHAKDITTSKYVNLIAIGTDEGIFVIDTKNRTIIKNEIKMKNEIAFEYQKILFVDKKTLLCIGEVFMNII